jgi:hypothetical protein
MTRIAGTSERWWVVQHRRSYMYVGRRADDNSIRTNCSISSDPLLPPSTLSLVLAIENDNYAMILV